MTIIRLHCLTILLGVVVLSAASTASLAYQLQPITFNGNIGYFYTLNENDGGSQADSSNLIGSLNADAYLWQPWFARLNAGGTVSIAKSEADTINSESKLLSSRLNLQVLPKSRFPFQLTFNSSDNAVEWVNKDKAELVDLGLDYRSRYFNVRQSYITLGGNRLDAWYSQRMRGSDINGDLKDNTYGAKAKWRAKNYNLYLAGTMQTKEQSEIDQQRKNTVLSLMHNYIPTSEFYIKTLATKTRVDNETRKGDDPTNSSGSFPLNSVTDISQVTSFFYWRPVHKPFTLTGGTRFVWRNVDFATVKDDQTNFNANVAGNYQVNRRFRITGTANISSLDTERNNRVASKQSVLANFRSDRYALRYFNYYWYVNGGVGNEVEAQFQKTDTTQDLNIGIGHSAHRNWVTGNRSNLRANIIQAAREFIQIDEGDTSFTLSHSASLTWRDGGQQSTSFIQLSGLDSRNFDDDIDTQIITLQLSHNVPISRLSSWGGHFTLQSTRRNTVQTRMDRFLTTGTGRLNYRHARLFGIYRLEFRGRFDISTTANREGGDQKQAELEGRLRYNIGLLNTTLLGRWVNNDAGIGSKMLVFQVNRQF